MASGRENESIPWEVQLIPQNPKAVEKVVQSASGLSMAMLVPYAVSGTVKESDIMYAYGYTSFLYPFQLAYIGP